ncbi:MAG TPA: site-specific DNA-methyltransferase [Candidatus Dormibacteraeota bacterium]|nr:site-specific DNA-methyltransferase [Candidatus Dormibacteraeota bacterium]
MIINTPETVPKSTPHLAAPTAETQTTAHSAAAQAHTTAAPDLSRRSLGEGGTLPAPVFYDAKHHIKIFQGDCLDILAAIPESCVDLIFADPPYFLSNNGITCHAGRMVSVNKGQWDKLPGADLDPVRVRFDKVHEFNRAWLSACQRVLKPNGTIWVSGTSHVIHSVGFAMQQLGFKLLNDISWVKPNPPPNLSCRYFTHATETIIWAARDKKSRHKFNYKHMKEIAGGKQMKSVWQILPPDKSEKRQGNHPTQKPVALLERILQAASDEGDLVLDPFLGGGTTILSALRLRRHAFGCELDIESVNLSLRRICSDLVHVQISAFPLHFDLDPPSRFMDRSSSDANRAARVPSPLQLVQQERRFYFIGRADRRVIFSVIADSLDEARAKFRASGASDSDALFIIKTETEIYLA